MLKFLRDTAAYHKRLKHLVQRQLLGLRIPRTRREDGELRFRRNTSRELRVLAQVHRNLRQPPKPAHGLEGRERDGHLGLVVRIFVQVGLVLVELLREGLVGMSLDGQGFARAQDFE